MRMMLALPVILAFAACKKEEEKGSLGLPNIRPPVARNLPEGISASGAALAPTNPESPLAVMGSRIFDPGPIEILKRLETIDTQINSISGMGDSDDVPCVKEAAKEWTLPANLPGGTSFPVYLQCHQKITSGITGGDIHFAFGLKDEYFYLVNIQAPSSGTAPSMATLVRAKKDGTMTDVWLTMQGFDHSETRTDDDFMWLAIKADDATTGFEAAVGGVGKGFGVDCGVRIKSDGSKVYGEGVFASYMDKGIEDCQGTGDGSQNSTQSGTPLCADATNLEATTGCETLATFTLPAMAHAGMVGAKADSDSFVSAEITGYGSF